MTFYLLHQANKAEIAGAISRGEINELICHLTFNESEFKLLVWEGDDEFSFGNKTYDLIRLNKDKNGKYQLFCFNDENDDMIFSFLHRHTKNNTNETSHSKTIKLLKQISLFFIHDPLLLSISSTSDIEQVTAVNDLYVTKVFDFTVPPPEGTV